jgi:hypothetical protein
MVSSFTSGGSRRGAPSATSDIPIAIAVEEGGAGTAGASTGAVVAEDAGIVAGAAGMNGTGVTDDDDDDGMLAKTGALLTGVGSRNLGAKLPRPLGSPGALGTKW